MTDTTAGVLRSPSAAECKNASASRRRSLRRRPIWLALAAAVGLSGCAIDIARLAPPEAGYQSARILGFAGVRQYGDIVAPDAEETLDRFWRRYRADWLAAGGPPVGRPLNALLLSGGADDGAFGAGVLNGWTAAGDRPVFDLVTGVSTGALIAPFAFLGSDYDDAARDIFLNREGVGDLFDLAIFSALRGALSITDNTPLRDLIASEVDDDLLDAIAAEHAKGRRLLVGTTNLDARRFMIWDLGAVASSGDPRRVPLFRQVLLASTSVPGVAAPVFIDVEIEGRTFQEMHVDGGVISSVFLASPALSLTNPFEDEFFVERNIYIIQNNKLQASYGPAKANLPAILGDTVSELIRSQSRGDQFRLFFQARRDGLNYHLAAVPQDFDVESDEPFDPVYLQALFDLGESLATPGYPWFEEPPGLAEKRRDKKLGEVEADSLGVAPAPVRN